MKLGFYPKLAWTGMRSNRKLYLNNPYDNDEIKADFEELYQQMNGMSLRNMDKVIYPGCKLCRDHEKAGFIEGIK